MRKIYFLLFAFIFTVPATYSQTTLVNSNFETGDLTNWQFANHSTNQWFIGTASFAGGAKGAYISNDGGATNAYATGPVQYSHIYVPINIPAGETAIKLSFDWKGLAEHGTGTNFDYLRVSVSTNIPVGGTMPAVGDQIPIVFNAQLTFVNSVIVLPASLAGAGAKYLIFSWANDGSVGNNPPATIDNVLLTSSPASPLTGTKTIGPAGDYTSFKTAVADLNANGVGAGGVIFNVTAGTVFNEPALGITATGTAANTIIFQRSGAGANPLIRAISIGNFGPTSSSTTSSVGDAVIAIIGGDYITFDGIDVMSTDYTGTTTAFEHGYSIRNASATDGAKNNVIKNASITLNRSNTSTVGLLQTSGTLGGGVNATNITGSNESNQYYNIRVQNTFAGVLFNGGTATAGILDLNNVISTLPGGQTIIGAAYTGTPTGDIGGGGNTYGIQAVNQSNISISFVIVRNITSTGLIRGIWLNLVQGLNNNVYNNEVYGIRSTSTSSTSGINAYELFLATTGTTHTLNAFNNFAYDITSAYTGAATATRQLKGFLLGSGTATSVYNISYNSVRLDGSGSPTMSNVCLDLGSSTVINNIRNNILANFTGAQTGIAVHGCIRSTGGAAMGAASSICNYNDYYVANTNNGFVGTSGTVNNTTIAAWDAALTANAVDANSISVDPVFQSPTNLHISPSWGNVDSKATPLSITTDIDGDNRHATTPDIGADEYNYLIGTDVGVVSLTAPPASGCYTAAEPVTVVIKNHGGNNIDFSTSNVTVTVTGSNGYNSNYIITSGTLASGGVLTVTMPATINMSTPGSYTFNSSTSVAGGDVNPANDALPSSVSRFVLGGTYTVGSGGNYPNLTAALFEFNNAGCITSPITYELISTYSSSGETFPLSININPANGTNPLIIHPAAGVAAVISGSSPANALIRIRNSYTTIDGINTGGASLLLENTGTTAGSTVIWNSSTAAGQGASNNTYRNLSIKGGVNQNTATTATFGIVNAGATLGTTPTGHAAGNDNDNTTIQGNTFTKLRYAIVSRGGSTANPNLATLISNNIIGPTSFGVDQIGAGGILAREEDGITITQNEIRFVGGDYNNTTGGADRVGISLATDYAWTPTSALIKNATVTRNSIHDIIEERTSSAAGIVLAGVDGTNPTNNLVANNMLYRVMANGTSSDQTVGIGIAAGNGDNVVYNSIFMTGDADPTPAASATAIPAFGVAISSTTAVNLTLKNNIIWNDLSSSSAPTVKNADIAIPASYVWGTGGSDYNDLYINPSNPQSNVGHIGTLTAIPAFTTLAQWQTASGQDGFSISADPVFQSPINLHISPTASAVDAKGTPLSVTNDFDGDTRNAIKPDIGADEFLLVVGNDLGVEQFLTPVSTGCYTNAEPVSVSIKNYGSIPVDFGTYSVTVTVTGSNGYSSSLNLNSGSIAAGASLTVIMPATINMATNMIITFNAYTTILGGDVNPANDALSPAVTRTIFTMGGEYTVGVGGNYTNLTLAVADFNISSCITSPVTFKLISTYSSAGETFPITINTNPANGTNPLTIRPDNGVTAIITGTSATSIIKLNGADYVVIDGSNSAGTDRSLTIENLSTSTTSTGVWLAAPAIGNGSKNNTIKNSILKGNSSTTTMSGIHVGGNASISLTGAGNEQNNGNTITNNLFMKTQYGLVMFGYSATAPDDNNVVSYNNFGTSTAGEGFSIEGIHIDRQNNMIISDNDVQNVKNVVTTSSTNLYGLRLLDFKNGQAIRNKVHNLRYAGTSTAKVYGITTSSSTYTTAGNPSNALIANNMVYDLTNGGASTTWNISGIFSGLGYGDMYYYNSVHLSGQLSNSSSPVSAAFSNGDAGLTTTFSTSIDVRNNIFSITGSAASGTGPAYAYYTRNTNWTNVIQDNNDLYAAATNATNYVGAVTTSNYATLSTWQTATSRDLNSVSADPGFTSSTDLHISQYYNWVDAKGTPLSVTNDIDGDTRNATTPDIGADEYVALYGADVGVVGLLEPIAKSCYGATETVTIQIKNFGSSNIDMSVTNIIVFATATPYGYNSNIVFNTGIFLAGATMNVVMPFSIDMSNPATYTFNASTSVVGGDINPTNNNMTPVSRISAQLNGTYTVGVGKDYQTLSDAITTFNSACIAGPVTFLLTSTYNSGSDVFPISINFNASQGANSLTIKPSSGVSPVITGSNATALLNLNGIRNLTIDGSNNGTSSKNLTISNTNTSGSAIRFINDATGNTVKNSLIKGVSTSTSNGVVFFSTAGSSTGNDNNTISNNEISGGATASVYAFYNLGSTSTSALKNSGNQILNNKFYDFSNTGIRDDGGSAGTLYNLNEVYEVTTQTTTLTGFRPSSTTIEGFTFSRNNIHDLMTSGSVAVYGIHLFDIQGTPNVGEVSNNFINLSEATATTLRGIYDQSGTTEYFNVYYNTINIAGVAASGTSESYYRAIASNSNLMNNIFVNLRTGGTSNYAIRTTTPLTTMVSDYNDIYNGGGAANVFGNDGTSDRVDLSAWRTATTKDQNSVSALPNFVSATNLHLQTTGNCLIDAAGTPIAGITIDIDANLRNVTTPDIGADEISHTYGGLAGGSGVKECSSMPVNATGSVFFNSTCGVIAKIFPAGGSPVTSTTNVCVTIDPVVMFFNAQPYVQRHYDIEPSVNTANATASVTLYFTQAEFNNYNAANGLFPDLPTGPGDAAGIARLNVIQYHGTATGPTPGDYPGPVLAIDPPDANIVWNAALVRWEITFSVTGFSGFYIRTGALAPVPITMEYFKGKKQNTTNLLTWKANCSGPSITFELQRSGDGRSFTGLTSFTANHARCAQPFDFTDISPLSGSNYYRLKMTEPDGHVYYSIIVLLLNNKEGFEIVGLLPTLVDQGTAILNISSTQKTKLDIMVSDMQGRVVQKQTNNIDEGSSTINMNFMNLAKGSYQLTGITPQGMVKTIRFVKQ